MAKTEFGVGIKGVGSYMPAYRLTNQHLENLVETDDEWITERTGMKVRPISAPEENVYVMGAMASLRAIESAGITPKDVDAVIGCTNTGLFAFPNYGSVIQWMIGARQIPSYEVGAGCTAQLFGLWQAIGLVKSWGLKNVLVVASDALSTNVDYQDRDTCVLLSDIASAWIVGPVQQGGIITIKGMSDGGNGHLLYRVSGLERQVIDYENMTFSTKATTERPYLVMQGRRLFPLAVRAMSDLSLKVIRVIEEHFRDRNRVFNPEELRIVPHHANKRIIDAAIEHINKHYKIPTKNVYEIIKEIGNPSAGSVGYAFEDGIRKDIIKPGDIAVLVAFGAGFTAMAVGLEVNPINPNHNILDIKHKELFKKWDDLYGKIIPTHIDKAKEALLGYIVKRQKLLEKLLEQYKSQYSEPENIDNGNRDDELYDRVNKTAMIMRMNRIISQYFERFKAIAGLGEVYSLEQFLIDHRKELKELERTK